MANTNVNLPSSMLESRPEDYSVGPEDLEKDKERIHRNTVQEEDGQRTNQPGKTNFDSDMEDVTEEVSSHLDKEDKNRARRQTTRKPMEKEHRSFVDFFSVVKAEPEKPLYVPFRAKKTFPADTHLNELLGFVDEAVAAGKPRTVAVCPAGISISEWLKINAFFYYNKANEYFGYLKDTCNCKKMTIDNKYEFLWADGKTIKKPINIPANDYIDYLMTWIEANFDDKRIFPDYDNAKHHHEFNGVVKNIFKRLFRVFGHMETLHRKEFEEAGVAAKHEMVLQCFIEFVKTYKLMDKKSLRPLQKLMDK